jgi:hypothetical protein
MTRPPPQSFLLRLWREHPDAPIRITIVPLSQPDEHRHFSTLAECLAWLYAQAHATDGPDGSSTRLDGSTTIVSHMEAAEK